VDEAPTVLNLVVAVVLVLLVAGVGWLTLAAPVRPRVAQIAFLLVAGFLLLNKVWSPQYSLWLLPLAVLARPKGRSLLLWQASEALLWVPRMLWYLGTDNRGVDVQWFFLGVVARDAAVVVLMALVVRDILRPDGDVVRTSWWGTDDPGGGPLDGAPDRLVVGRHRRSLPRYRPRYRSGHEGGPQRRDLLGVSRRVPRGLEDDGAVGGPRDLEE
jgi:uncharacterized membrane protein